MRKWIPICLFLYAVALASACTKQEDPIPAPCMLLGEEIQDLILFERATRTLVWANDMFRSVDGVPVIDGCIAEVESIFYNLEQLVSFEASGRTIILRFE